VGDGAVKMHEGGGGLNRRIPPGDRSGSLARLDAQRVVDTAAVATGHVHGMLGWRRLGESDVVS
jgi:hypothetical protein